MKSCGSMRGCAQPIRLPMAQGSECLLLLCSMLARIFCCSLFSEKGNILYLHTPTHTLIRYSQNLLLPWASIVARVSRSARQAIKLKHVGATVAREEGTHAARTPLCCVKAFSSSACLFQQFAAIKAPSVSQALHDVRCCLQLFA